MAIVIHEQGSQTLGWTLKTQAYAQEAILDQQLIWDKDAQGYNCRNPISLNKFGRWRIEGGMTYLSGSPNYVRRTPVDRWFPSKSPGPRPRIP